MSLNWVFCINIFVFYREQLQSNANKGQYYLRVNMDDLNNFDDELSTMVRNHPADFMPVVS